MKQSWTTTQDTRTGIHKTKFSNGLELFVLEKTHLPIATVMITYRFGGAHCAPGTTGVAHLLEHLMFKGTKRFAKGEIDSLTQKLGGTNNAFTGNDYTSYFFNFTKDHWEKALEIESDRMVNCVWDKKEFLAEKKVVLEELASSQDSPYEYLSQEAEMAFYKFHPYRYPILGWKEDLEKLTIEDIDHYYKTYYVPNNAILVIVGDVENQDVVEKVNHYFGSIPSQKIPKPFFRKEMPFKNKKRLDLYSDTEVGRFAFLFPTCSCGSDDEYALELIDILLSTGKTSRLYNRLVLQDRLLQKISTQSNVHLEGGVFWISGELVPDVPPLQIEKIVQEELESLRKNKITEYELLKSKNICLSGTIFHQETAYNLADWISQNAIEKYSFCASEFMEKIQQITPKDIQEIAQKYLDIEKSLLAWSIPKKNKKLFFKPLKKEKVETEQKIPSLYKDRKVSFQYGTGVKKNDGILDVKTYHLENGIEVMALENHTIPIACMKLYFLDAMGIDPLNKEGMGYLFSSLLTEGTKTLNAQEISHTMEFLGANLSGACNGITAKFISQDFEMMFGLMADIVQNPVFPHASLEREKKKLYAKLVSLKDDPHAKGMIAFRKNIYKNHPYGKPAIGTHKSVANIQVEDLQEYHQKYFIPKRCILSVVGDIDAEEAYSLAQKYLGSWDKKPGNPFVFNEVALPKKPYSKYISMNKEQLIVYMGHIGIRRSNPDYYKLLLLEQILGQGQGFTDRLSKKIREEFGLCYSVECSLTSHIEKEPGFMLSYLATTPKNYPLAMKILKEEIALLQEKGVSDEELESARSYLKGRVVFSLEESEALAYYLLYSHLFGLGFDYVNRFPKILDTITKEDVQAVAKKYLHPEVATTIVVGPVEEIPKQ
ncbi:MAG: insulinase family protein [Candidatus Brocadiae bacterium]|nr:insulinase family protein [Candidatus Brocadiia bacterium]